MNARWLVLWLCFLQLSPTCDALGNEPVEENAVLEMGMSRIAVHVKKFLVENELPMEIAVGSFAANPRLKVTTGAEIKRVFVKQLGRSLANYTISVLGPVASRLAGNTFFISVNVTSEGKEREIARVSLKNRLLKLKSHRSQHVLPAHSELKW